MCVSEIWAAGGRLQKSDIFQPLGIYGRYRRGTWDLKNRLPAIRRNEMNKTAIDIQSDEATQKKGILYVYYKIVSFYYGDVY